MASVKNRGTRLEDLCARRLRSCGWPEPEYQAADLPGTPDFVLRAVHTAIFVDSCFWHGCPKHLRMPATNTRYWKQKIARNRERDRRVRTSFRRARWSDVGVWVHKMLDDVAWCAVRGRIAPAIALILQRAPSTGVSTTVG